MIYFKKNCLVIEIESYDAIATWRETHEQLIEVLKLVEPGDDTNNGSFYRVFSLLQEMLPSYSESKRLMGDLELKEIDKAP